MHKFLHYTPYAEMPWHARMTQGQAAIALVLTVMESILHAISWKCFSTHTKVALTYFNTPHSIQKEKFLVRKHLQQCE
jgi:hypothetical protein